MFDAALRWYERARIHALLGERGRAVELLRESVARGLPKNVALDPVHLHPDLQGLRTHPGFRSVLRGDSRAALPGTIVSLSGSRQD